MLKLNPQAVKDSDVVYRQYRDIGTLQTVVKVMCGGGYLGNFAARQPADFYIDDRCGRLPYRRKEIMQAVSVLTWTAEARGLNPRSLPEPPDFHGCGIF